MVGCRVMRSPWQRRIYSCLPDELRFQVHLTDAIDLAGDVVTIGGLLQADVAYLGAALDHRGCALDLEILDDDPAVAVSQYVAIGITDALVVHGFRWRAVRAAPLMSAVGAHPECAIRIGVLGSALRARHRVVHGGSSPARDAAVRAEAKSIADNCAAVMGIASALACQPR